MDAPLGTTPTRTIDGLLARIAQLETALGEARREHRSRLEAVLEQLPATVWTVDRDLMITSSLGAGLRLLDLETDHNAGKTLYEHFGTDDDTFEPIAMHLRALRGESVRYEGRTAGAPTEVSVEPLRDEHGEITGAIAVSLDVSARKHAEAELIENERRLRVLAEHIPGVIYTYDFHPDHPRRLIHMGPGLDEIIGPRSAAAVEADFDRLWELLHPDDRAPIAETSSAAVENEDKFDMECRVRTDDGSYTWIESISRPRRLAGGWIRWSIVLIDIAERKSSEVALRGAERRYRDLVENAADMMYALDVDGTFTYVSDRLVQILGYAREELLGKNAGCIVAEEDHDRTSRAFAARVRGETVPPYEFRIKHRDGTLLPVEINSTPIYDADGRIIGTQSILRDVSERHRAEAQLRESELRFRQFADHVDQAFWLSDSTLRRLLFLSAAYERIWGRPRQGLLDNPDTVLDAVHPDDRSIVADSVRTHRSGRAAEVEYRIIRPDGAIRWIRDTSFPIKDEAGKVCRVAGVATDITDRMETDLRQRMMMRELDHRVKNNLASVLSIASQTAGGTKSVEQFMTSFASRIRAMFFAHEVLARRKWQGAELGPIVEQLSQPFQDGGRAIVSWAGDEVILPPHAAAPVAMVLHELLTNAAHHGALDGAGGRVQIEWSLEREDPPERLRIRWTESGGAPIAVAPSPGVGLSLIRGFVTHELRGTVDMQFDRAGLLCEIVLPWRQADPETTVNPRRDSGTA